MSERYYAETLEDGRIAIYDKETKNRLTICTNSKFMIAWMCIEEDYNRKIEIIKRIMLCEDGIELDGLAQDNQEGIEEFSKWYDKVKYLDRQDYYKAVDSMYRTAMNIAKTYYTKDFERESYHATNMG